MINEVIGAVTLSIMLSIDLTHSAQQESLLSEQASCWVLVIVTQFVNAIAVCDISFSHIAMLLAVYQGNLRTAATQTYTCTPATRTTEQKPTASMHQQS